ncbi:conserved hypothetical protein [Paecilomyces variotii No. 5]|uniref:Uncharacterized protein n=1 Tax=Byssochlamys spectabilis (strain No. 5 / NBRC 109023) TaxID=1356009 RepID=V5FWQ6_BYSSN|nr:conserved hypothetical protein [Paecilomyces variotii No. 5]
MTSTPAPHSQHPPNSNDFPAHPSSHGSHLDANGQMASTSYTPSDNQLAGLVEAATAAAGQDVSEWAAAAAAAAAAGASGHHHLDAYGSDMHLEDDSFADTSFGGPPPPTMGRLRPSASTPAISSHGNMSGLSRTVSKKRKRNEDALDPALTASASSMNLAGHQHQSQHHLDGDGLNIRELPPQQSLSDARAAGVHSAAALFRQPSSNKKYTRPPMSKLFASLELSPENFLHLQAAAKAYMLDDNHPERRDCVGQRGKGDTEMVKLKLWNCVRHFLEAEGYGERFFGENVVNEGMGPRQYIWPRDQHKIISLVIPLLRRMVTNERQRQYAIETRKGGGSDERRRRKTDDNIQNLNTIPEQSPVSQQSQMQHQYSPPTQTPAPPQPQPPMQPVSEALQLGLTDLVLEGYPTDWDAVRRSYDTYNHDSRLDNLWSVSGLQQPDWCGLVAAVDSHYQIVHNGDYNCGGQCEEYNISRIIQSDPMSHLSWRVGGNENIPARNELYGTHLLPLSLSRTLANTPPSASSIARDVSRIIRDSLAHKHEGQSPIPQASRQCSSAHDSVSAAQNQFFQQLQQQSNLPPLPATSGGISNNDNNTSSQQYHITLRINIVQNNKRILPRFDVPAEQCPDLETAKQLIGRRFAGQLPETQVQQDFDDNWSSNSSTSGWKFKVWLPEGLVPVQNDGEWTIAQLSAGTVDWMDGDLRVVVDIGGGGEEKQHPCG